ncbi:integral membrane protein [Fusarium beomiforme]|uniref:Integral membrane protein n=1 Tax=Fusarium beomiforme TaxID=44412 RepID=A0A9P5DVR7_9HYPO|nr:integral membrane protein [Fusarium beomiforme]
MASQLELSDVEFMTTGYRNRTILVFSICFPLAVLSVSLRYFSRVLAKNPFWWDDWLSLTGLFMTGGFCTCVLSCLPSLGLLSGKEPITNELLSRNAKGAYVAELFYYCNQFSLKFSILMFYWRVFASSTYMRRSIHYIGVCILLWFISSFLVAVLQCVPVQANWDPIAKQQPGVKCVDLNGFFFGTSIPNIVADLVLVALPIPQVLQLKITSAQKCFVILSFVLGGFVVITSVVRLELITKVNFATFAVNWSVDNSVVWTLVENCCGVISVCLPSLRPIIRFIPWKAFQNSFTRSYGASRESKSQSKPATRMDANPFGRSRQRSQWSQIESTNEGQPEGQVGIRKHTEIEISSIEMASFSNSSQVRLAGVEDNSKQ